MQNSNFMAAPESETFGFALMIRGCWYHKKLGKNVSLKLLEKLHDPSQAFFSQKLKLNPRRAEPSLGLGAAL